MLQKASIVLVVVGALLSIGAGLNYLLRPEFMPYHAEVVGRSWSQLDPPFQAIVLGMLKIIGGSFLACGATMLWLLIPLRRGEQWAGLAVLSVAFLLWVPTQYVTLYLRTVAPAAQTPVLPTALLLSLFTLGALLHLFVHFKRAA